MNRKMTTTVTTPDVCAVSNSEAMKAFEKGLEWLECQQEASLHSLAMLRGLRDFAARKRYQGLKKTKVEKYFCSLEQMSARSIVCLGLSYCFRKNKLTSPDYPNVSIIRTPAAPKGSDNRGSTVLVYGY